MERLPRGVPLPAGAGAMPGGATATGGAVRPGEPGKRLHSAPQADES